MTLLTLLRRNFVYGWRSHLAMALAVAVGTAVIAGSLTIGRSVQQSLRRLAFERLANVGAALHGQGFFREQLAADCDAACAPLILLKGEARRPSGRASLPTVQIMGLDSRAHTSLGADWPTAPAAREADVNPAVAADLQLQPGDTLLVNVPAHPQAPALSAFARRRRGDTMRTLRLHVRHILPPAGTARFSLRTDAIRPHNIIVSLAWLQSQLGLQGRINTILAPATAKSKALDAALLHAASAEDYGLRFTVNAQTDSVLVQHEHFVLPQACLDAVTRQAEQNRWKQGRSSVYLANAIARVGKKGPARSIPYSVIAGHDLIKVRPGPAGPGIALTDWAAQDLGAVMGDQIQVSFYQPRDSGSLRESKQVFCFNHGPLDASLGPAAIPVPPYAGLTDAEDMGEWNPPFPIDLKKIRPKDEAYWDKYGARPKALVDLAVVRAMWQTTSGMHTSSGITGVELYPRNTRFRQDRIAILQEQRDLFAQQVGQALTAGPSGFAFRPVRREALVAARGSTDFRMLFLSLGFFLIIAAAALVGLLFRLAVEARARDLGILRAVGFLPHTLRNLLLAEGVLVATLGAVLGVPGGLLYAYGILWGLGHSWSGAVADVPLTLYPDPVSLAIGAIAGLAVAAAAVLWSLRQLGELEVRQLLARSPAPLAQPERRERSRAAWVAGSCGLVVIGALLAWWQFSLSVVIAFLLMGMAMLVGLLALLALRLRARGHLALTPTALAQRNAQRQPTRSLLTVGLLASATFLIVTVAAHRQTFSTLDVRKRTSGAGGFVLRANTALAAHADMDTARGRAALGFDASSIPSLHGARIYSLRIQEGENAGCLNLNQPSSPQVVGVPMRLIQRGGFAFAKTEADPGTGNPWDLLDKDMGDSIPAFADASSAQWILKKGLGETIDIPAAGGKRVALRLVGLLKGSLFAGELVIAERHFLRVFNATGGYRSFLVEAPVGTEDAVAKGLRENLAGLGVEVVPTAAILAHYARVQNTYLSTFETLGGLGLALGALGVVAVLLRHVLERRAELALLRALGFTRTQVMRVVLRENAGLVVQGVMLGTLAALVASGPHLLSSGAAVQWESLVVTLALVLVIACGACWLAARWAMRGALLAALRSE